VHVQSRATGVETKVVRDDREDEVACAEEEEGEEEIEMKEGVGQVGERVTKVKRGGRG
jgi:hypothetical protein